MNFLSQNFSVECSRFSHECIRESKEIFLEKHFNSENIKKKNQFCLCFSKVQTYLTGFIIHSLNLFFSICFLTFLLLYFYIFPSFFLSAWKKNLTFSDKTTCTFCTRSHFSQVERRRNSLSRKKYGLTLWVWYMII